MSVRPTTPRFPNESVGREDAWTGPSRRTTASVARSLAFAATTAAMPDEPASSSLSRSTFTWNAGSIFRARRRSKTARNIAIGPLSSEEERAKTRSSRSKSGFMSSARGTSDHVPSAARRLTTGCQGSFCDHCDGNDGLRVEVDVEENGLLARARRAVLGEDEREVPVLDEGRREAALLERRLQPRGVPLDVGRVRRVVRDGEELEEFRKARDGRGGEGRVVHAGRERGVRGGGENGEGDAGRAEAREERARSHEGLRTAL